MKKTFLLFAALYFSLSFGEGWGEAAFAQTNLVPNGDFEQFDTCQNGLGQLYRAKNWINPISPLVNSSPDYYNSCNSFQFYSVPINAGGFQYAHSGAGYSSITLGANDTVWHKYNNFREYLEVELSDTLKKNYTYCVQFYVSACDSFNYTSNDIQVCFSDTLVHKVFNKPSNLNLLPQFSNQLSNKLTDRIGWTSVFGKYTSNGGEKYIVIGNFADSSITTVSHTNWTSSKFNCFAIYYVDDVSVTKCDSVSGISSINDNISLKIFPNPSNSIFTIESSLNNISSLAVYDVVGKLIMSNIPIEKQKAIINLSNYANGIYFLKAITNNNSNQQFKLIKN